MKKIEYIHLLLLIIPYCFLSCQKEPIIQEGVQQIDIPNHKAKQKVKVDHIFDLDIIPLETTEESVIFDRADKIQFINDKIYITDAALAEQVSVFSMQGKFLQKISGHSPGPTFIGDLHKTNFDRRRERLEIYDKDYNQHLEYSLDGVFQKKYPSPVNYNYKARINKELTIYDCMGSNSLNHNLDTADYNAYSLLVMHDTLGPVANWRPYPPAVNLQVFFEPWDLFYKFGNYLHYYRPFCDTIFRIYPEKLHHKFLINYLDNPHPHSLLFDPFIEDKVDYCLINQHPFTSQTFETARYLFVFYHFNRNINCFAFDKVKNEGVINAKTFYFKDIGLHIFPPQTTSGNGKDLVRLVPAHDMRSIFEEAIKNGKLPEPYIKMYEAMEDSDNPFLIRYTLKI
jgi:hypothetical protein